MKNNNMMKTIFEYSLDCDDVFEQIQTLFANSPQIKSVNAATDFFFEQLSGFPNFEFASIFMLSNDTMEFEHYKTNPVAVSNYSNEMFDFLIDSGAFGDAVSSGTLQLNRTNPFDSLIFVQPLISIDEIIGVVILNVSEVDDVYLPKYSYALSMFSTLMAKVLKIKQLERDEQSNAYILEQRIAERTMELLKSKVEMHEKFKDLRTNLTMALPHEIRTPVGMIMGNSDLLAKNIDYLDLEDIKDIVNDINIASRRINDLFENYIYFANLEVIAIDPIALDKLQDSTLEYYDSLIADFAGVIANKYDRYQDLIVKLEPTEIYFSEAHFTKLLNEVIDNCFKYSEKGTPVIIDSYVIDQYLFVSFIDHGRGMTNEQIATIDAYIQFERFKYEQQGLGLGLAIVRRLVNLHNGELTIESEYGKYTKFTIKLKVVL